MYIYIHTGAFMYICLHTRKHTRIWGRSGEARAANVMERKVWYSECNRRAPWLGEWMLTRMKNRWRWSENLRFLFFLGGSFLFLGSPGHADQVIRSHSHLGTKLWNKKIKRIKKKKLISRFVGLRVWWGIYSDRNVAVIELGLSVVI